MVVTSKGTINLRLYLEGTHTKLIATNPYLRASVHMQVASPDA